MRLAEVVGYTTPAVSDIGGASIRIRFSERVQDGGYLLGIRRAGGSSRHASRSSWIPAIAGIPDDKGFDRYSQSREQLAEVMVMARPLVLSPLWSTATGGAPAAPEVGTPLWDCEHPDSSNTEHSIQIDPTLMVANKLSFLSESILERLFPPATQVDVILVERVTDFHLGLNAGRWLQIRTSQICTENIFARDLEKCVQVEGNIGGDVGSKQSVREVLNGTGLELEERVEEPPSDAAYLFEFWGGSANAGVSGQRIIRAEDLPEKE